MTRMQSAFISYSTDASNRATAVSKHLSSLGVDSFIFEKDLKKKGVGHQARIRSEIETRDAMILILSARSKNSSWVSHELGIATGLNKPIIVFKTAHNMKMPDYLDIYNVSVLKRTSDLNKYFGSNAII